MRKLTVDGRARPGSGVGRFCCQLIEQGVPAKEIAKRARDRFGGKTSVECVRWYASRMQTGELSRTSSETEPCMESVMQPKMTLTNSVGIPGDQLERVTAQILDEHPTWIAVSLGERGSAWLKRSKITAVETEGLRICFCVEPAYLLEKIKKWSKK